MIAFNNIQQVDYYLDGLPQFQKTGRITAKLGLDRVRKFSDAVGAPHRKLDVIHVAGTNGKGTVCSMLASVYIQSGYRTGLYTSPHMWDVRERFCVNGQCIGDEDLLAFFQQNRQALSANPHTYFELTTVIALWWFWRSGVDVAIIETGLGGRFDATNIVEPEASVITTVDYDHTEWLGDSIEEIAGEKAGIIKPAVAVVTGNLRPEAERVIHDRAGQTGSPVHSAMAARPEWQEGGNRCVLHVNETPLTLDTPFANPVQRYNIAVCHKVVELLQHRWPVESGQFAAGLSRIRRNIFFPGRFEQLLPDRNWYFDGAHNVQALQELRQAIRSVGDPERAILVFTMMNDKWNRKTLDELSDFRNLYYFEMYGERTAAYTDIKVLLPHAGAMPKDETGIRTLLTSIESELVIFTGSFYFYSTVKKWIQHL